MLLAAMVAGLLLSQSVCFDRWKTVLPLGRCLAVSWQRRCQRWQTPGQDLHLATGTTLLWNRYCVVMLSVVAHGRAVQVPRAQRNVPLDTWPQVPAPAAPPTTENHLI